LTVVYQKDFQLSVKQHSKHETCYPSSICCLEPSAYNLKAILIILWETE